MADANTITLPPCVYRKNGGFYLVKKNKWHFLGREHRAAIANANALTNVIAHGDNLMMCAGESLEMSEYVRRLWTLLKANAKKRGIDVALTRDEFYEAMERSRGFCEITGIPFSLCRPDGAKRRPFAPSVDRIDSSLGYTKENCRVILYMVNIALSDWGLDVLGRIAGRIPVTPESSIKSTYANRVKSTSWDAMTKRLRISCSAD